MRKALFVSLVAMAALSIGACSSATDVAVDGFAAVSGAQVVEEYPDPAPGYGDPDPVGQSDEQAWLDEVIPLLDEANRAMEQAEQGGWAAANGDPNGLQTAAYGTGNAEGTLRRVADRLNGIEWHPRYAEAKQPMIEGFRIMATGYQAMSNGYWDMDMAVDSQNADLFDSGQGDVGRGVSDVDRGFQFFVAKAQAILWNA